jgi:spore germination protein YaaH
MVFLFIVTVSFSLTVFYYSLRQVPLPEPGHPNLIIGGKNLGHNLVWLNNGEIFFPLELVAQVFDPHIFWDETEETAVITTNDRVIRMPTASLTAYVNEEPITLRTPVTLKGNVPYIPIEFLATVYRININHHQTVGTVVVDYWDANPALGITTKRTTIMRDKPSHLSPWVIKIAAREQVTIFGQQGNWYQVRDKQGHTGFIPAKQLTLVPASPAEEPPPPIINEPWRPAAGQMINLTWEYVGNRNPNLDTLNPMAGVNVVSPTWFQLSDRAGNLQNKASTAYVDWAHRQGYQVWGLVTNDFDPDLTSSVLNSTSKRQHLIRQLLSYAVLYQLDGINLDFENMYLKDQGVYVQFVRELAPLLREQGLTLSVDVTFVSGSENWSKVYNRKALAHAADYIAVMAYDEHWSGSPQAGSVASLPWVRRGLETILAEIPPEKLLLGMPLYARLWEETTLANGQVEVSSRALSMTAAENYLEENNLQPVYDPTTGQNYAEHTAGNTRYRIWLEDKTSLAQRVKLAHAYNLAGIATWRRDFAAPEIWPVLAEWLAVK